MKKIVVLSGAGISAESGINTFRDSGGLWEGHDIYEVASPQGFRQNPALVLDFYNKRRKQLLAVTPNPAHYTLVALENYFQVEIITQNVDDLHERSGSKNVLHLHGELRKVRSTGYPELIYPWDKDLKLGDYCAKNTQLRPHIVWFGEDVPELDKAIQKTKEADILVIIGTSMQVYPAASLLDYKAKETPLFFIDPNPAITNNYCENLTVISEKASVGTKILLDKLVSSFN